MQKLPFTKMAGAGNDFIIINASTSIKNIKKLAIKICNRSTGVGGDGLLILDTSKKAQYKMRIINADGSEAEMCGNGARCMAAYIAKKNKITKDKLFTIETLAGIIKGQADNETATVQLSDPFGYNPNIKLMINNRPLNVCFINTGVPHTTIFVENLKDIDVNKLGQIIRNHKEFQPKGTNVNFIEQISKTLIGVRTYERGVEAETKACGTGSVACALITYLKLNPEIKNKSNASMKVKTTSGEILKINFNILNNKITNVWLYGSAKFIAEGTFFIK